MTRLAVIAAVHCGTAIVVSLLQGQVQVLVLSSTTPDSAAQSRIQSDHFWSLFAYFQRRPP